jgi:hypothetical protein
LGNQVKAKKMQPAPDPICVGAGLLKGREFTPSVKAFIAELELAAGAAAD